MDAQVASDIVALMGRELKACRESIRSLQEELRVANESRHVDHDVSSCGERIQAAEAAMALFHKNIAEVCEENRRLREKVAMLQNAQREGMPKKENDQDSSIVSRLSREEEDGADELYVQQLRDHVVKYRQKYKSHKATAMKLDEMMRGLECDRSKLDAENDELRVSVELARKRQDELTDSITVLKHSLAELSPGHFDDIASLMAALPHPASVHRPRHLKPISWFRRDTDFDDYLTRDCGMPQVASKSLFAWGRLCWCTPEHCTGVIVGPRYIYDSSKLRWSRKDPFERHYGQIFQLFYEEGSLIYYAGRFKALDLRPQHPSGVSFPREGVSSRALGETTTVCESMRRSKDRNERPPDRLAYNIADLYLDGILKVECLGLEIIDFDEEVYRHLSSKFDSVRTCQDVHHRNDSKPNENSTARLPKRPKLI